jgi:hypothetical protein
LELKEGSSLLLIRRSSFCGYQKWMVVVHQLATTMQLGATRLKKRIKELAEQRGLHTEVGWVHASCKELNRWRRFSSHLAYTKAMGCQQFSAMQSWVWAG